MLAVTRNSGRLSMLHTVETLPSQPPTPESPCIASLKPMLVLCLTTMEKTRLKKVSYLLSQLVRPKYVLVLCFLQVFISSVFAYIRKQGRRFQLCHQFLAVFLLGQDMVMSKMSLYIQQKTPNIPRVDELIDYFTATWVNGNFLGTISAKSEQPS